MYSLPWKYVIMLHFSYIFNSFSVVSVRHFSYPLLPFSSSFLIALLFVCVCVCVCVCVSIGRFSISTVNLERQRIASGAGGLPSTTTPNPSPFTLYSNP